MTEQPKLLPCPFCGGDATIEPKNWAGRDFIGVFCNECLIFQDSRSATEAEAITAWNTRRDERVDALVSALTEAREIVDAVTDLSRDCIGKLPKAREALARNKALLAKIDAALQLIGKE